MSKARNGVDAAKTLRARAAMGDEIAHRVPGLLRGRVRAPADFDAPLPDDLLASFTDPAIDPLGPDRR